MLDLYRMGWKLKNLFAAWRRQNFGWISEAFIIIQHSLIDLVIALKRGSGAVLEIIPEVIHPFFYTTHTQTH